MHKRIQLVDSYRVYTKYVIFDKNKNTWMMGVVIGAIFLEIKQIGALLIKEI